MLTARADKLKEYHLNNFERLKTEHAIAITKLYKDFEEKNTLYGALKVSDYIKYFAENYPVTIFENELIVGTDFHWGGISCKKSIGNVGHYIADFEGVLKCGLNGLTDKVNVIPENNDNIKTNKQAFKTVISAFSTYILRYAEEAKRLYNLATDSNEKKRLLLIQKDCTYIAANPPESFRQALQLVWFMQIFLETEANNAAISFGRADKYLYPYYKNDIEKGIITDDEVLELIMCFYIKASEGDESQMLTLMGCDENGKNIDNPLSLLFLKAQEYIKMRQPSLSVRINSNTKDEYLQAALMLTKTGNGMPGYVNDEKIIAGLENIGIDKNNAADYGIVGCYEAAPQGVYANTVAYQMNLCESLNSFFKQCKAFDCFEDFFEAYKKHFENYYKTEFMPSIKKSINYIYGLKSPVCSCFMKGCTDTGLLVEECGDIYSLAGINILGIGIVIDSIYTAKKLVFDDKLTDLEYLYNQTVLNFEDKELLKKIKAIDTAYGSDTKESNSIAAKISEFIGKTFKDNPIDERIKLSPALFWFTADISLRDFDATVNGRRKGELISYGVSPCATPHTYPLSSILLSAANIKSEYFPDGCPMMIAVTDSEFNKPENLAVIIKTYFERGGFHLAINTVNANTLENALKTPDEYKDVIVKISGYSAKFVGLENNIQKAIVERARNII